MNKMMKTLSLTALVVAVAAPAFAAEGTPTMVKKPMTLNVSSAVTPSMVHANPAMPNGAHVNGTATGHVK